MKKPSKELTDQEIIDKIFGEGMIYHKNTLAHKVVQLARAEGIRQGRAEMTISNNVRKIIIEELVENAKQDGIAKGFADGKAENHNKIFKNETEETFYQKIYDRGYAKGRKDEWETKKEILLSIEIIRAVNDLSDNAIINWGRTVSAIEHIEWAIKEVEKK